MDRTGPFTDLYELTMLQSYLEHGRTGDAVFDLHVRSLPPSRGYLVASGLTRALAGVRDLRFSDADLDHLAEQGLSDETLAYLADFAFTGTVRAVPEGRVVFPYEPILQVEAPLPQAQLVETLILNRVHLETVLATKAARCVTAADGATLVDFGARRAHGADAARAAARCAYLAGFDGTSLVSAAADLDVPCYGTMAHSYVLAFDDEADAFASFARSFPDGTVLLVDTYDTLDGVRTAIEVADRLEDEGVRIGGVRLDSGDLADLAARARRLLDDAGRENVRIVASGGLDEHALADLVAGGAPIDGFGVGTSLVVSRDAPSLDMSYKLAAYDGEPVMKRSSGKETLPGGKQVRRATHDGRFAGDRLVVAGEGGPGEPLLEEVDLDALHDPAALHAARDRCARDLDRLPEAVRALDDPAPYPVERSAGLQDLVDRARTRAEASGRSG